MAKRKLSKQQKWRIQKIQDERTKRATRKETQLESQLSGGELSAEQEGLIIAHYGQQLAVEALEPPHAGQIFRCYVRANIDSLVTGDQVIWRAGPDNSGVIVARQPRESALKRPDKFGQLKPIAANIDQILIVIAAEPEPHHNLVDRYLVASEAVGIPPLIILNKQDLINDANRDTLQQFKDQYQQLGYDWIDASTNTQSGLDDLKRHLAHKTSIFVGQSGVGKSSLIKMLLPDEDVKVGDLSENVRKGTHTTTTAKLFHLPSGGDLIDSPGIREFGLWHIDERTLEDGFVEFRPHLGHCRFRNCRHLQEPGCALQSAQESGEILCSRMESFLRIRESLQEQDIHEENL
ncbi:small ribosomal subunit biogenesis GTPase RsgA [Hahella sp. CR1]|uniref:small ribosomal subunit biogenesis GTPase RsgA n=1 Tax=Hahella sp. CR1 TaxID=2992807 RepID=UPI0024414BF7|nr:small ribosomal subunit biogenesis GTPase RsgA [Hahella sp. CR1]MDG9671126.1 small ribosomal subunit biogenesis GTPase RsgA [Hahella sp. CR1]